MYFERLAYFNSNLFLERLRFLRGSEAFFAVESDPRSLPVAFTPGIAALFQPPRNEPLVCQEAHVYLRHTIQRLPGTVFLISIQ